MGEGLARIIALFAQRDFTRVCEGRPPILASQPLVGDRPIQLASGRGAKKRLISRAAASGCS